MKEHFFAAASVAALALAAGSAQASGDGWYLSVGGGYNALTDTTLDSATLNDDFDAEGGYQIFGAVGYAFPNALRTELELSYRDNDFDTFETLGPGTGDISAIAGMLNAWWDFNRDGAVSPYVGGGIGFASIDTSIATGPLANVPVSIDDRDTGFAFQGGGGFSFDFFENVDLDIGYRYFRGTGLSFGGTLPNESIDSEYAAHTVMAALRFWAQPDRAPAPAPVREQPRLLPQPEPEPEPEPVAAAPDDFDFTVYFELDKSNLSSSADRQIREAAQLAAQHDIDIVLVEGHTDTSGTTAHNQVLSQARAETVRQSLIRYGVPANRIRMDALGESRPATQTGDGVREPLNRRAYVAIRFAR